MKLYYKVLSFFLFTLVLILIFTYNDYNNILLEEELEDFPGCNNISKDNKYYNITEMFNECCIVTLKDNSMYPKYSEKKITLC